MTPQRNIVGRVLDNSHNEIAPHPRNSFSTLMMIRVREIKVQRLGATVIANALGIGRRASIGCLKWIQNGGPRLTPD
jgi:hypothetical protein